MTLLIDAKNDAKEDYQKLQQLQTNLENWYNDAMDRVSGWYKRYTQNVLMIIGLGLAIAFNVSSVRIAHTLWIDRDARQGMVDAANDYLKRSISRTAVRPTGASPTQMKTVGASRECSKRGSSFCLWDGGIAVRYTGLVEGNIRSAMSGDAFVVLIGWLITAGALSLGASFWFDTLNKIMVIRNTVKPQEKSQIEGSKD